jgi:fructose/tagatose bisphosphate aldolase
VEAELQPLSGVGGELDVSKSHDLRMTEPTPAAQFVRETGIDALAVNVGQVHLHGRKTVRLNLDHLSAISSKVNVPLVLHGATSVAISDIRAAIELGVRKVNVGSALKQAYFNELRQACHQVPAQENPYEVVGSGKANDVLWQARKAMQARVQEFMLAFGSVGRRSARTRSFA